MNKVFVLNASPIILLGKADLLNTVSPLADLWIVPEKVVSEVEAKRPIASYLSDLNHYSREFAGQLDPLVMSWDLGQGESEVLTIALQKGNATVVLDDLLARKCAKLLIFWLCVNTVSIRLMNLFSKSGPISKILWPLPRAQALAEQGRSILSASVSGCDCPAPLFRQSRQISPEKTNAEA